MANRNQHGSVLRPPTEVLTRGFDPRLSVGSARPAVFRSSTYVFSSPETAERAFDLMAGRVQAEPGEQIDLVYSRFNHPNAEILEDQIVPLETGAHAALVFNSGMAAIMTAMLTVLKPGDTVVYTVPIYGGTQHFIQDYLSIWGVGGIPVLAGNSDELDGAVAGGSNVRIVLVETPANPTMVMSDIARAVEAAKRSPARPLVMVDNTLMGPTFQHPLALGADLVLYSATKYLSVALDASRYEPDLPADVGELFGPETYVVPGRIYGGLPPGGPSMIPDECVIRVDTRPQPGVTVEQVRTEIDRCIAEAAAADPRVAAQVKLADEGRGTWPGRATRWSG